jgi:hypothetical protein
MLAQNPSEFPLYPKYQVMGVVYAPPGSASSVTYGGSTLAGCGKTTVRPKMLSRFHDLCG